jgi:hypothetical protein
MTAAELSGLGICLPDVVNLVLKCERCGETWVPQLGSDGKLPFDYWICPARCNAERTRSMRA